MPIHPISSNIILYCRRWKATVHFYRDIWRLPVIFATDWFVEFRLTATSRLSIADEQRATVKSSGGTGITIALELEDIAAAHKLAQREHMRPTPIRRHPWNALLFHVFDPEGHRIELWQPLVPGETPDPE
jgi:catechol 2,3-dioxygenase-like lactoylglutathione lyase family enzyme